MPHESQPVGARPGRGANLSLDPKTSTANGYHLETSCEPSRGSAESRSLVAVVEARNAATGAWGPVWNLAAPVCSPRLTAETANGTTCWRAESSLQPEWSWFVRFLGSTLAGALGFFATLGLALMGQQRPARWAMVATFWLYAGCLTVGTAGEAASAAGMWNAGAPARCFATAISDLAYVVPYLVLAGGMTVAGRSSVRVLLTFALVHIAALALKITAVASVLQSGETHSTLDSIYTVMVGPHLLALALAIGLTAFRQKAMWEARRLVRGDAKRYNVAWRELMLRPGMTELLGELQGLLSRHGLGKGRAVRQLYRQRGFGGVAGMVLLRSGSFDPLGSRSEREELVAFSSGEGGASRRVSAAESDAGRRLEGARRSFQYERETGEAVSRWS